MYMSAAYLSRRIPQLPRTAAAATSRNRKQPAPQPRSCGGPPGPLRPRVRAVAGPRRDRDARGREGPRRAVRGCTGRLG